MRSGFVHPILGELYPEDVDWQTDETIVPFSGEPIAVCLAEGSSAGPSAEASAGFDWIAANWSSVLTLIQSQAFQFYEPYLEAVPGTPDFQEPEQIWGTEILSSVRVTAEDEFEVTMRFVWQADADPHEVTFYVENGQCESHTVDG